MLDIVIIVALGSATCSTLDGTYCCSTVLNHAGKVAMSSSVDADIGLRPWDLRGGISASWDNTGATLEAFSITTCARLVGTMLKDSLPYVVTWLAWINYPESYLDKLCFSMCGDARTHWQPISNGKQLEHCQHYERCFANRQGGHRDEHGETFSPETANISSKHLYHQQP